MSVILFVSCESDIEKVQILGFQEAELKASTDNVILSTSSANQLVYSLMWNAGELTTTGSGDYGVHATALVTTLQFSENDTFEDAYEISDRASSKSYTGKNLNSLVLSLGAKPNEAKKFYIRLKSAIASNVDPLYSNVVQLTVTPYEEIAFLYMPGDLSGGWDSYTTRLCSREGNGIYQGFVEAAIWSNFNFSTEANNTTATVYGSSPDNLYTLDKSADQWKIWFDEGGYFLLEANLKTLTWSKTPVTNFSVTGEFNSWSIDSDQMSYDSVRKVWTITCNITNTLYGVQIIMNKNWDIKYGTSSVAGELVEGGENIVIDTPGIYTITMDLNNPAKYTYTVE